MMVSQMTDQHRYHLLIIHNSLLQAYTYTKQMARHQQNCCYKSAKLDYNKLELIEIAKHSSFAHYIKH